MSRVRSFRDLVVWQRAVDLAAHVYKCTDTFPKREIYALTDDIRRCVISISANIAEGYGRGRDTEFDYFLRIAYGSLCELESHFEVAKRLHLIEDIAVVNELSSEVGKMINGLRSKMALNGKVLTADC